MRNKKFSYSRADNDNEANRSLSEFLFSFFRSLKKKKSFIYFLSQKIKNHRHPSSENKHVQVTCVCVRVRVNVSAWDGEREQRGRTVRPTATRGPTANHSSSASFVRFGSDCALLCYSRRQRSIQLVLESAAAIFAARALNPNSTTF